MEGILLVKNLLQQGETGPEGRLLCGANSPGTPTVHVLAGNVERNSLPIQLPTVRPILCPKGVHEDHAPCYSMTETARMSNHYLHRLQPNHGLHKGVVSGSSTPDSSTPDS